MTYLSLPAMLCSAGNEQGILEKFAENKRFLKEKEVVGRTFLVGEVENIPSVRDFSQNLREFYTRSNALLLPPLLRLSPLVQKLKERFGKSRIAVVIGATTAGIEENFQTFMQSKNFSLDYRVSLNALEHPARFVQRFLDLEGPSFGVSTACTSGLKALIQAHRLLENNLCDAVVVGGADALSTVSLCGFESLGILSKEPSNPFSRNRKGINIGEGACIFVASKEPIDSHVVLESYASNNDAFHLTKQDCEARKSIEAIQIAKADLPIDYVNLHATGTPSNEIAESKAIFRNLPKIASSGIKGHIGHTLGAAAAIEAGVCIQLLHQREGFLPLHLYDGDYDPALDPITLIQSPTFAKLNRIMSVNFAFGGESAVAVFGRKD